MIERCENPMNKQYHRYGGRGIKVCEEWKRSLEAFCNYVGSKPSLRHQLDRIDNDGNYEPGNVRWATPLVNARNSTKPNRITYQGRELTVPEFAEEIGVSLERVNWRLRKGWSPELIASVGNGKRVSQSRVLNDSQVALVRKLIAEGNSYAHISRVIGCSNGVIRGIASGKVYI